MSVAAPTDPQEASVTDIAPAVGMAVAGLAPVATVSRRDAVVTELKRGVVLGSIQPGEKLT